jgi:hypothetical protein
MSPEQKEIKLRPHHVWGLHDIQENTGNYYLPDEEYIANWREQEGEIKYTEKLILHGRDTIRFLFENPAYKFTYVDGQAEVDTICLECNTLEECHNPECDSFHNAQQWDKDALNGIPFLRMMEFGKKYSLNKFNEIRDAF